MRGSRDKSTQQLGEELRNAASPEAFIRENEAELVTKSLSDYLFEMLILYHLERIDVIKNSGLDYTYAYQIFDGRRNPKRDKLLILCFGFPLTAKQTQYALKYAGIGELYPRIRRDAYILYALERKMTVTELNLLLHQEKEEILA